MLRRNQSSLEVLIVSINANFSLILSSILLFFYSLFPVLLHLELRASSQQSLLLAIPTLLFLLWIFFTFPDLRFLIEDREPSFGWYKFTFYDWSSGRAHGWQSGSICLSLNLYEKRYVWADGRWVMNYSSTSVSPDVSQKDGFTYRLSGMHMGPGCRPCTRPLGQLYDESSIIRKLLLFFVAPRSLCLSILVQMHSFCWKNRNFHPIAVVGDDWEVDFN